MSPFCGPAMHTHEPMRRECQGCHRRVCGPDDGWKTTTGRVYVCEPCLDRARRGWMARS